VSASSPNSDVFDHHAGCTQHGCRWLTRRSRSRRRRWLWLLDTLKIDRSFVNDMTATPEGLALVSTIINLAHSLKLKVVAEGVETEEQSRLLRLLNCDEMQPVPGEIFETRFPVSSPARDER
jgi:EAL domain-containing protein (putative c-di-GMP-specific phosphodiesterase class I)